MIQELFNFIGVLTVSIVVHELGHLFYLFMIGKNGRLVFEIGTDVFVECEGLNDRQYSNSLIAGIFLGAVPIVLVLLFLSNSFLGLVMNIGATIAYFWYGINGDMKELRRLKREKQEKVVQVLSETVQAKKEE